MTFSFLSVCHYASLLPQTFTLIIYPDACGWLFLCDLLFSSTAFSQFSNQIISCDRLCSDFNWDYVQTCNDDFIFFFFIHFLSLFFPFFIITLSSNSLLSSFFFLYSIFLTTFDSATWPILSLLVFFDVYTRQGQWFGTVVLLSLLCRLLHFFCLLAFVLCIYTCIHFFQFFHPNCHLLSRPLNLFACPFNYLFKRLATIFTGNFIYLLLPPSSSFSLLSSSFCYLYTQWFISMGSSFFARSSHPFGALFFFWLSNWAFCVLSIVIALTPSFPSHLDRTRSLFNFECYILTHTC